MSLKIIIADDHEIVREGLRNLLNNNDDFEVVAEAGNGRMVMDLVDKYKPDLVVMDIMMPGLNGIEAARCIIANHPDIKIIVLSMYSNRQIVMQALKTGVSGYILKDNAVKELIKAIKMVMDGYIYLCPVINTELLKEKIFKQGEINNSPSAFADLSNREREVLQLISEGKSSKEIAHILYVSVKTIDTHRQKIMSKLNIHSIAGLTKYAIREGLTSSEM